MGQTGAPSQDGAARQDRAPNQDGHRAAEVGRMARSGPGTRTAPGSGSGSRAGRPPAPRRVLAVVAHPDDESFGLGAVISRLGEEGGEASVLCFTRGEASTLHAVAGELGAVRAAEFERAAALLGVRRRELLDYPDGGLAGVPLAELAEHVTRLAGETGADALLVFDEGGITGHPDHCRATEAALAAASGRLDVLAWALPDEVAAALNGQFGTSFVGRPREGLDIRLDVDRRRQREAIAEHASQSTDNPVLWRRLELLGDAEWLRRLAVSEER